MRTNRLAIWLGVLVGAALAGVSASRGQWHEDFESVQTTWRLADRDCQLQVLQHRRTRREAHRGQSAEYLDLSMGRGTYARVAHRITPARIVEEMEPSVWVKANRAGLQFQARVVFPHARDPRSGEPLSTLLDGTFYRKAGTWQQLWIEDVYGQLSRKIPILRSQFAGLTTVDDRQPYIDMVVLNAYTGPGRLQLYVDDLMIDTLVKAGSVSREEPAGHRLISTRDLDSANSAAADPPSGGSSGAPHRAPGSAGAGSVRPPARVQGDLLIKDDRPVFIRGIEHNGEPLDYLKQLGFNTVQLATPPTALQLEEAESLGLWLIPPPPDRPLESMPTDRILAWHLGQSQTARDLDATRRMVDRIHALDAQQRPIISAPTDALWQYSRISEILLLKRQPLGTSFPLSRHPDWLENRAALARLGTPIWAAVQTEPARATVQQLERLGFPAQATACVEPDQIRILAFGAVASGARGLLFCSEHSLADSSPISQLRAKALQRVNLDLQLVEPWLAGGNRHRSVDCSNPQFRARLIETNHAELVIAFPEDLHQQFSLGPAADDECTLIIDSAASSPDGYDLSYGGLAPLRPKRVPGGVLVTWKPKDRLNLLVLTTSPLVLNHLSRRVGEYGRQATQLQLEIQEAWLQVVSDTHQRLADAGHADERVDRLLATTRQLMAQSQRLLAAGDLASAHQFSHRAAQRIGRAQQIHWKRAWRAFPDPIASPCCTHFTTVPFHWELADRLQKTRWSRNLLAAGDLESLEHAVHSDWQREQHNSAEIDSLVEFSLQQPHGGRACLRLAAWPKQIEEEPAALESPVIRIDSAPVPVRAGQLLRIHGWIRIPERLRATHQGLVIKDSLTGEALAYRTVETDSWSDFTLYRVATEDHPLRLSFELLGLGEVWLDDVTVQTLETKGTPMPEAQDWEQLRPGQSGSNSPLANPSSNSSPQHQLPRFQLR